MASQITPAFHSLIELINFGLSRTSARCLGSKWAVLRPLATQVAKIETIHAANTL
jgi:hypothetical protein